MNPVIRSLPVKLTEQQTAVLGEELALAEKKLQESKEAKKESAAAHSEHIKELEAAVSSLARKINSGVEFAEIKCHWETDIKADRKYLFRDDTMDIIEKTGLTDEDRQVGLFEAHKTIVKNVFEKKDDDLSDSFSPVPAEEPPQEDQSTEEHGSFVNARYRGLRKKKSVN